MEVMKELLDKIKKLKKSKVQKLIAKRIKEFEKIGKSKSKIFSELCFCILTANSTAERCINVQNKIGNAFTKLPEKQLAQKLKKLGARFHTKRANYICKARKYQNSLKKSRDWLIENIKGLGMKEASHFLRNIGHKDIAIIDFHIIDLLAKYNLIKKPKTLTRKKYLEIEKILKKIAKKAKLSLAELDLYLWYIETGKILK